MKYFILMLCLFIGGGSSNVLAEHPHVVKDNTLNINISLTDATNTSSNIASTSVVQKITIRETKGIAAAVATTHATQFDYGYRGWQLGFGLGQAGDNTGFATAVGFRTTDKMLFTGSISKEDGFNNDDYIKGAGVSLRF